MNIKGKEVSLRFGMLSVEIFLGEADKLSGLSYYGSFATAKIIYAGMVNYYEVKQEKQPLTFEEIYDYVENEMLSDSEMVEIKQALADFGECQALKKKTEQIEAATEELKKKLIGTTPELQPTQQD
jgi:hypothetical protein